MNTITLQVLSPQILGLLYELQKNNMLRVVNSDETEAYRAGRLSEKYRGAISKEKGRELLTHIEAIRNEWQDTL